MESYQFKQQFIDNALLNYHKKVDDVIIIKNYRTDGSGKSINDERLIKLSNLIHALSPEAHENLFLLHDHKGILTAWMQKECIDTINVTKFCWEYFNEYSIDYKFLNQLK
jgi:hypothetical protein